MNLKALFMNVFADTSRYDPLKNFKYAVTFTWNDGSTLMSTNFGFNKVSGLKSDIEVIEYREGGDNLSVRKLAGLVKQDPVTFEKGMTDNSEMWDSFAKMFDITGASDRTASSSSNAEGYRGTVSISIQNRKGTAVRTYKLVNAWISGYETGDLDAQGNAVMIEKITLQHEGLRK